jgi:hypothetical protein
MVKVSKNQIVEKLKSTLDGVKEKSHDIKAKFNYGTNQFNEYCSQLLTDVHLQYRKLMMFRKNETLPEKSLLGSLSQRQLSFDVKNVKRIRFSNVVVHNYNSEFISHLFKLENDTNVAFYVDIKYRVNMVTFYNNSLTISNVEDLLPIISRFENLKVIKSSDNKYIIHVWSPVFAHEDTYKNKLVLAVFDDMRVRIHTLTSNSQFTHMVAVVCFAT